MERVLFVGNSFTYYNNMPKIFEALANQAGCEVQVHSVVKGGWYLNRYADPDDEFGLLLRTEYPKEAWDYIVWQDQSANPALDPEDFYAAAHELCHLFPCRKQHVFYQTWAYEEGSEKLASVHMDYETFHQALAAAYREAAKRENALCVPVGDAFALCHAQYPLINLYKPEDRFHPSLAGSYLAACVFVGAITGKDVSMLAPLGGETRALCEIAQNALDPQSGG